MSKELWRGHGLSIALLDEHTFTVSDLKVVPEKDKDGQPNKSAGQERADNFTYHNRLHDVLENAANCCANNTYYGKKSSTIKCPSC